RESRAPACRKPDLPARLTQMVLGLLDGRKDPRPDNNEIIRAARRSTESRKRFCCVPEAVLAEFAPDRHRAPADGICSDDVDPGFRMRGTVALYSFPWPVGRRKPAVVDLPQRRAICAL